MLRDSINKSLGSKAFNIIFAILVSVALWLYIAYAENTDVQQDYNNLDVTFVGDDIIEERDLIVTKIDTEKVSLRISGKRNAISKLSKSAITLTADMSLITNSGVYQIPYDIEYTGVNANALSVSEASVDYITVTVGKLLTRDIEVRGVYDAKIAEGYSAKPLEFNPQTVEVSGPESIVSALDYAWVTVERETISKTVEDSLNYTLYDKNGNQVRFDNLKVSDERINVTLPIVMVKDVALKVNLFPGAGAAETNAKVTVTPSTITLSGDATQLEEINAITLDSIDLSDFVSSFTERYTIAIPNGLTNETGTTEADVTVQILGLTTVRLSATNIKTQNVPDGYTASIVTQSLDVTVRGKETDISKLKAENISIVADLSTLGSAVGTFSVDAKVYVDGFTDTGAVGDYKITVTLAED